MFRFNLNTRHITTESDSKETSIDAEDRHIISLGLFNKCDTCLIFYLRKDIASSSVLVTLTELYSRI